MDFQASLYYLLIYLSTLLLLQLPPMQKSFILYLVFAMSFGDLSLPTPPRSNSKLRQNWKYVHTFRRRRLAYHLVILFRRRIRQRPQRLDGTKFSSPRYATHRRSRRRNHKDKDHHHCRGVIKPGNSHFRFHDTTPPHILDNFCGSRYFTRLPRLISKFQGKNGTELKAKLK